MTSVIKVRTGDYHELANKYTGDAKFTDESFPTEMSSIGEIEGLPPNTSWKRISEIVKDPKLIVDGILPTDIVQKRLDKCYFLSTIATLAEKESRIITIFADQKESANGLYKVKLRVNGYIREIIVDDFVPVDEDGDPLFCQPNDSEIWVMILEKAWAKLKGSYERISCKFFFITDGNPTEVFKAVTYSPSQLFAINETEHLSDKIWDDLEECLAQSKPVCAGSKPGTDSEVQGLVENHFYTIVSTDLLRSVR